MDFAFIFHSKLFAKCIPAGYLLSYSGTYSKRKRQVTSIGLLQPWLKLDLQTKVPMYSNIEKSKVSHQTTYYMLVESKQQQQTYYILS